MSEPPVALKTAGRRATVPALATSHPAAHSRRLLLRNIGYLAGSQVTTWISTVIYTVIVTRAIGPHGAGMMGSALAAASLIMILAGLGTATLIVKEVAQEPAAAPSLVSTAIAVQLVALAPAAAGLVLYAHFERFDAEMRLVLLLYAVAIVPSLVAATLQAALQGIQRMGAMAASGIATNLLSNLASIAIVLAGHANVPLLAGVAAMTQTIATVISVAAYRRYFPVQWHTSVAEMIRLVRRAWPYLAAMVAFSLYIAADTIILTTLSTSTEVGWYASANRLFGTLFIVTNILCAIWLPRLSAEAARKGMGLVEEARQLARLGLLSSMPLAVGGAVVAAHVVRIIWGPAFAGASAPLMVLLLMLPATTMSTVTYQVLVARDAARLGARVMGGALVVNVVANVILILLFRSVGQNTALAAALCLCLTEYGMAAASLWLTRHQLGLPTLLYAGRALLAALVMGAVVALLSGLPLPVVVAIGAVLYGGLALVLRLVTWKELSALRTLLGRLPRSAPAAGA